MSDKLESPKMPERKVIISDVTEDDLPQIKDWEVGKKYEVKMMVKMVSKRQGSEYPDPWMSEEEKKKKNKMRSSFESISVEPLEDDDEDEDDKKMDSDSKKRAKEIGAKRYG